MASEQEVQPGRGRGEGSERRDMDLGRGGSRGEGEKAWRTLPDMTAASLRCRHAP